MHILAKQPGHAGFRMGPIVSRWRQRSSASAGFSLLELMAVMLLMLIMMGIATTAFRGVMRGAGVRGAVSTVRGVLSQARQQAMNNGQPVAVLLRQPDNGPGYMRTVMSFGRVHSVDGNVIVAENELPWTASAIAGARVYHYGSATGGQIGAGDGAENSRVEFTVSGLSFGQGDEIAFEVGALRELPTGLRFDFPGDSLEIIFHADGSSASDHSFIIRERVGAVGFTVEIDSLTGGITVGDMDVS